MQNQGGVVGGTPSTDVDWRNHGTAVLGEFGGDVNALGITGIAPDAQPRRSRSSAASARPRPSTRRRRCLRAGDIILLEMHRPGPRFNFAVARRPARLHRRRVVARRLRRDPVRHQPRASSSSKPPATAPRTSTTRSTDAGRRLPGDVAQLVQADQPRLRARSSSAPARRRRERTAATTGPTARGSTSRTTARSIDAQGWGREVTTTAATAICRAAPNEDLWYTDTFSGTSSASPIVVGAFACSRASSRPRAGAAHPAACDLLRATGSPQQDAPGRPATQRIGNRPGHPGGDRLAARLRWSSSGVADAVLERVPGVPDRGHREPLAARVNGALATT